MRSKRAAFHTHTHTHTQTDTHTHCYMNTHSIKSHLSFSVFSLHCSSWQCSLSVSTLAHTHTHSLTHTHPHTLTHSHTHPLYHSTSHPLSHSPPLPLDASDRQETVTRQGRHPVIVTGPTSLLPRVSLQAGDTGGSTELSVTVPN